jgi:hypothetical protein
LAFALFDEYFIKRKLYPNVDFNSGLIYKCTFKFKNETSLKFDYFKELSQILMDVCELVLVELESESFRKASFEVFLHDLVV